MIHVFNTMRLIARPVCLVMTFMVGVMPLSQVAAQPKNGEAITTNGSLQLDSDLKAKWDEAMRKGKIDFRAASNNSSALALDLPASMLGSTIFRMNGAIGQVFARYDSVAAEGVIDVVWLERNLNDTVTFKLDRVGGKQGNSDFGSAWGSVFTTKSDGYHCDNRFLVSGKNTTTKIETCANPLQYRSFTTDENGRAILSNISFDAFIGLVGLVQGKFKAAEAWVAADNTAYGDVKRKVDQWTTSSSCGTFCKRTTQHVTMNQIGVSWYVSTPGVSDSPDAVMGGYCVDPADAADGTCDGPKVVGQTAFIKAAPDAQLPQDTVMAFYYKKSQEGMTGLGFALAVFVGVGLAVVTGGAASGMSMSAVNAAIASNTVFSGIAGLAAATAGGYAALSTVASDMRGVDQVQNGFLGNLSDGQLASTSGSAMSGEMNRAVRNKFIYADPLFTESRGGGMPNFVYGNGGGGDWNGQRNALMSSFALGSASSGAVCNRGGLKVSNCAISGRMIRPDDFFVQTEASPDVAASYSGQIFNRTLDPATRMYSNDPLLNLQMQQIRSDSKNKIQELLNKRKATQ